MIEIRDLTKSYMTKSGRHFVFRDANAVFPSGKNIGIIGPNGAGKSTLLRLIGKIDFPDRGSVITEKKISWPVGLSGGFQGSLTGRDNVRFVCRVYGANGDIDEKIAFVQEFACIGEYFDMPIRTYSSGMRARLAFGLSMAFDFDYYLVDEITAVGDSDFKSKSRAVFKEKLKKANLIIASHSMNLIKSYCDIVAIPHDGDLEIFDDIKEAMKFYEKLSHGRTIDRMDKRQ